MPKDNSIVFLEVDREDIDVIHQRYPDARVESAAYKGDELLELCRDAEVVSPFIYSSFPREIIEKLPNLKLLVTRSVGTDHIDLQAAAERGITVCNIPDYGANVIAEHAFALLLSAIRHIPEGDQRVVAGNFDYHGLRGIALKGKTIGIVGTGKIGKAAAHIAFGFGMKILAFDPKKDPALEKDLGVTYVELPVLFQESDVISLHVPSIPATVRMVNRDSLAQMKPGVIIVNTARGNLVDSSDLLEALESRQVQYAVLDVLENEARLDDDAKLVRHPRSITTPHVAFYTDDSVEVMLEETFQSIEQWKKGEKPENVVEMRK